MPPITPAAPPHPPSSSPPSSNTPLTRRPSLQLSRHHHLHVPSTTHAARPFHLHYLNGSCPTPPHHSSIHCPHPSYRHNHHRLILPSSVSVHRRRRVVEGGTVGIRVRVRFLSLPLLSRLCHLVVVVRLPARSHRRPPLPHRPLPLRPHVERRRQRSLPSPPLLHPSRPPQLLLHRLLPPRATCWTHCDCCVRVECSARTPHHRPRPTRPPLHCSPTGTSSSTSTTRHSTLYAAAATRHPIDPPSAAR